MQKSYQILFLIFIISVLLFGCAPKLIEPTESSGFVITTSVTIKHLSPTNTVQPTFTPTVKQTITPVLPPTSTPVVYTTIAFTGVIVPARCVQAAIDEKGDANYIYDEVRDILESADITVGVYNATMSDNVDPIGCQSSWELVGRPENADALKATGFDVMSVATNHIKDCGRLACGNLAFFDTLENLRRVGILPVGAGENLDAAMQPVVVEVNGIRFGFVSLGDVNERVFADWQTPGIGVLTYWNLREAIERAQAISDIVIVLPHSGPEDTPEPTLPQKYWARTAVEAGADLIVENHAHVVQGYQVLGGIMVFYGLGNFVFDQIWSRDHQQGVILKVVFQETTLVSFEFIPTVVDQDGTVHLAGFEESQEILERIESLSKAIIVDE